MERQAAHPVKDIVLPLGIVIGLVLNAWYGGNGWGRVSKQLETIDSKMGKMDQRADHLESDVLNLQKWQIETNKDNTARDVEFRLFRAYTKGRIARLPYHASDDGE
jgi:hypothetical protein